MKITKNYAEGITLDGVRITNNGINDVVSFTWDEMWQIYHHMKRINIRRQIEDCLQTYSNYSILEGIGKTTKDILDNEALLCKWIDYIYNDDFDDFCEEYLLGVLDTILSE